MRKYLARHWKSRGRMGVSLALLFMGGVLAAVASPLAAQTKPPAPAQEPAAIDRTMGIMGKSFTGDFDAMRKRRLVRALVVYSKTHYFVDKGTQRGLSYETLQLFEDEINKKYKTGNLRIHVAFIPVSREEIIPALRDGRGDLAAANLTITPERQQFVDFTSPTLTGVAEIVVTGPASDPVTTPDDLSGKEVYVRESSSYFESLQTLNADLKRRQRAPVKLRLASDVLQDEDLLEMLNAGLVKNVVVDDHLATFWAQVFPKITPHPELALRKGGSIAVMIRKDSPLLKAELDAFFAKYPKGSATRNILLQRYLKSTRFVKNSTSEAEMKKFELTVEHFKKYSGQYDLDYLLLMAQGYQESRLDQSVKSHVGAVGVMQVMPATGREMNVGDITILEPNIHAGVKYLRHMEDVYFGKEPMDTVNRALFAFAAYNAGPGRVAQLRKDAVARGLNPNLWFNNVEVVASEKIGRETVTYVSNIYKYYVAYKLLAEQRQERKEALETH
jgi:membrane-bound lytic murein transglycosylase MltF